MIRSHRPPHAASPLGTPIPDTPHAVSVSLPAWSDNVAYEENDPRVHSVLRSGYPRFVYHDCIKRLSAYCQSKFGSPAEAALVFPSRRIAAECRQFVAAQAAAASEKAASSPPSPPPAIRIAELHIMPTHNTYSPHSTDPTLANTTSTTIFAVLFPTQLAALAKQFWQHSGEGVSTRFADRCLRVLAANESSAAQFDNGGLHYRAKAYTLHAQEALVRGAEIEATRSEHDLFVEERYGRNLGLADGERNAKVLIRKRIAGVLGDSEVLGTGSGGNASSPSAPQSPEKEDGSPAPRGVAVSEADVYLFPSGMSAIYNTHRVVRAIHPNRKSVQFGFPYLDTLKIQEKFGPGCHFLGFGSDEELDALERRAGGDDGNSSNTMNGHASEPPDFFRENGGISAVFCELPSNPLLKTPDLVRLRRMADKYGFLLVVDETVGNFVNVDAARWADVLVSSLTKIFSGDSNVMGGSAVISPKSPHYALLTRTFNGLYEDTLDSLDAVFLERNSRTFIQRIHRINATAHALTRMLAAHPKVMTVHHPSVTDAARYAAHARRNTSNTITTKSPTRTTTTTESATTLLPPHDDDVVISETTQNIGYGGLLSIVLHTDAAAERFYDALDVAKGPSLGTNFTLACPYTILAHYGEMEWAEGFGVLRRLVRVSVGLEDAEELVSVFERALEAA
ncbi:hypothetical protein HDU86_006107 [Geranomyces michiganensis]|nr:hypothetical protein HDU86_006107 [Geranomyces michiganensis]